MAPKYRSAVSVPSLEGKSPCWRIEDDNHEASAHPFCPLPKSGTPPPPRFLYNGIGYCSLCEAACATLLASFDSEFKIIPGRTFQVALGQDRFADFYHRGHLIEYHEPRLVCDGRSWGDFGSRLAYEEFERQLRQVRHQEFRRTRLLRETGEVLKLNYIERRREIIDAHPRFQGTPLIVVGSATEFYLNTVLPFHTGDIPSLEEFLELFHALVRHIGRENSPKKRRRQKALLQKCAA